MIRRRTPKSFFKRVVFSAEPRKVRAAAAAVPERMAGRMRFNSTAPCLKRKTKAMAAAGRKKRRFIPRAVLGSMFRARVSHRIRRLPPPMPRPDRKPRIVPTNREMGAIPANSLVITGSGANAGGPVVITGTNATPSKGWGQLRCNK